MIAYIKGKILIKDEKYIIIDVNNVGYQVFTPNQIISELNIKQEIELFIYSHIREDQFTLYGFKTQDELKFFKLLLTVSGIGPKTAIEISSTPINLISNAILSEDTRTLSKIPGIGKKSAERLILELKNKIEPYSLSSIQDKGSLKNKGQKDAIEALNSLGYSHYQIIKVLSEMDEKITKTEDIVRYFLKNA